AGPKSCRTSGHRLPVQVRLGEAFGTSELRLRLPYCKSLGARIASSIAPHLQRRPAPLSVRALDHRGHFANCGGTPSPPDRHRLHVPDVAAVVADAAVGGEAPPTRRPRFGLSRAIT